MTYFVSFFPKTKKLFACSPERQIRSGFLLDILIFRKKLFSLLKLRLFLRHVDRKKNYQQIYAMKKILKCLLVFWVATINNVLDIIFIGYSQTQ